MINPSDLSGLETAQSLYDIIEFEAQRIPFREPIINVNPTGLF